jgi:uncharacterized short protein YbdD (DUF466 family)
MNNTHILRRNPRAQTVRALHAEAQERLDKLAPVECIEEDDPHWVALAGAQVKKLKEVLRLLRGLSDRNRYSKKYRQNTIDKIFKLIYEDVAATEDAFRTGVGHKEDFDLAEFLKRD